MRPIVEIVDRGAVRELPAERRGLGLVEVVAPVVVRVGERLFTIEPGFVSDASSVPWWARWKIDPRGRRAIPGIFHDWLLRERLFTKRAIDWLFMGALHAEGVADLEATLMFLAVRTKGFPAAA